MKIHLVTDSSSDISKKQAAKYGISVVPLTVSFGEELYTDGVDLSSEEFFKKLKERTFLPKSSQPSPEAFRKTYESIASDDDIILSVHVARKLSGTLNSAESAAKMVGSKVILIDTLNASQGVALTVLVAAEAAHRGFDLDKIIELAEISAKNTFSVFAVDTLEFLQKNGRIGKAASLVGSLLHLKPILYANEEGTVGVYGKVRGRAKIVPTLVGAALERVDPDKPVNLSVVHCDAEDHAHELENELKRHYEIADFHFGSVGPAIGTHIGPGAISLMIQPSFDTLAAM